MSDATPPTTINGTVSKRPPSRHANDVLRGGRKHLTETEIEKLMAVARREGRYGHRDATAILVCFRHGLRAAELCELQWSQVDFTRGTLHVTRKKGGDPSTHYLSGTELRALRKLQRDSKSRFVFVGERGDEVTTAWFRKMFGRLGVKAEMPFPINPHMLRHSCGYKFANEGKDTRSLQGYLGHRNAQSTVIYTQLSPDRFKGWEAD
jgi:integrase